LAGAFAFAQEGSDPDALSLAEIEVPQGPDAHELAEREIALGEGGGGLGIAAAPLASTFSVFRVLLTLGAVALAIYALVFLLKKISKGPRPASDPFLKVLATAQTGANRSVHVVSLGSQAWLVGSADHGLNLIGEINDKQIIDALLLEDSRRSAEAPGGARRLDFKSMLNRFGISSNPGAPTPQDIRKRSDRLKGV